MVVRSDGEPALFAHVKAARAMTVVSDVPLESVHEQVSKQGTESREWTGGRCSQRAQGENSYSETAQKWVLGGESQRLMTAWHGW